MGELLAKAIHLFKSAEIAFSKFITANDAGTTGGHQSGFHIHKGAWNLFFDRPGEKGLNTDIFVTIKWQNDFETSSRFIYYGQKTRNEYRLTRFGKGFPFLSDDNVGDLLVICKTGKQYYHAYVISADEEIEDFLSAVGISITETNKVFTRISVHSPLELLQNLIEEIVAGLKDVFPPSRYISQSAEEIYFKAHKQHPDIAIMQPDKTLVNLVEAEYTLFKAMESHLYSGQFSNFKNIDDLINFANTLLNRRKSRAGKALENHLAFLFEINKLRFEMQAKTEGNKKPDFLFPDSKKYHSTSFRNENLFFLGAKTTCKDRWRQILNEADKIPVKHLMTLQQGISQNQLEEMQKHKVILVVPENYINSFPKLYRSQILNVKQFIQTVKSTQ